MSKKYIIFFIILIILTIIIGLVWKNNNDSILSNRLYKTKTILVIKSNINDIDENTNKITDSKKIDEIVKIVLNGKKISDDEIIPYTGTPKYIIRMYDKKDSLLAEIKFFYFSDGYSYINLENDYYHIDADSLLKIIDF